MADDARKFWKELTLRRMREAAEEAHRRDALGPEWRSWEDYGLLWAEMARGEKLPRKAIGTFMGVDILPGDDLSMMPGAVNWLP